MATVTRRQWLKAAAISPLAASQRNASSEYSLFWGDLHNHNAVGYAQGSLERTYDIARSHLDFLAFTPHAQWHDMPEMPNQAHMKWVNGFRVLAEEWPRVQKMAESHNTPGKFVSLLACEWHSSAFGDYCIYHAGDRQPLHYFDHVKKLQQFARETGTLIVPHHLAYKQGWRGANLDFLDASLSPVVEIFSEHGLSERDRGPHDFIRHSNGGRWTRNTLQAILERGLRVGFIASSDDHLGYPGAWGEGMAGVYARDLTRTSLLEALRARRTIAVTGDRIQLAVKLNGQWMGSSLPFTAERELEISVAGQDEVDRIEVIRNGRVIHRNFPVDAVASGPWPGEALCRLEFGWGPWAALNMARVCDWEATATIRDGKILAATPCFQSGPFDENRRNRIVERTGTRCRFQLYTGRHQAYEERATNAIVLHVEGGAGAQLELSVTRPSRMTVRKTLGELARNNEVEFSGPFTSESLIVHRLVTPENFRARFRFSDTRKGAGLADWYYVRVTQSNGQQAWSSPIWLTGPDRSDQWR